jgi:hypothetical protein
MVGKILIDEAGWLLAVDTLTEHAVEERVADVELVDRPLSSGGEVQNGADGGWLDDGTKRLAEVDAGALREAADDPPGLVAVESAVGMSFEAENP